MSFRRALMAGAGLSICALPMLPANAAAAESDATAAAADANAASDAVAPETGDIVVTAEKQERSIQRVPAAVTALQPAQLAKSNIVSLADVNGFVPGLTVARNNGLQRALSIRGVGFETAQNASSQPGVAFNIDQVYIAANISTGVDLFDVARVEVARGPQGTVYGQNATGGVINLVTRQPELGKWGMNADLSYGNYDLVVANAGVNVPVGDVVAVRVAGHVYRHDGFSEVPELGNYDLDNADNTAVKGSVLFAPTDRFSATFTAQHWEQYSHGTAQKNILDREPDIRKISQDYAGKTDLNLDLYYLTLHYDAGFANITGIGSYQKLESLQLVDNDRLDYAQLGLYDVYKPSTTNNAVKTGEINITSKPGGRLNWIVGAYYLKADTRQRTIEFKGTDAHPTFPDITSAAGGLPYNYVYSTDNALTRKSWAGFGQVTYEIVDGLRLTGGLRYSDDRFSNVVGSLTTVTPVSYTQKNTAVTGKGVIEYDLARTVLGYASYSRGYKPGGVNINTRPVLVGRTFDAEHVNAYEVGVKSRLFDNRVTLNAAGFYYTYRNFQYIEEDPIPYQGGAANIPNAHTYGGEVETVIVLTPNLRFNGNLTALGGKFSGDYYALDALAANRATALAASRGYGAFSPVAQQLRAQAAQNTDGNTVPKLPKLAGTAALEHTADLGIGTLTSRVEAVYRGSYQFRIFNDSALDRVPSYTLVNLNFTYRPVNSPLSVSLVATNLLQSKGITSRFSDPFGAGSTSNTYVPPRQVYGTLAISF